MDRKKRHEKWMDRMKTKKINGKRKWNRKRRTKRKEKGDERVDRNRNTRKEIKKKRKKGANRKAEKKCMRGNIFTVQVMCLADFNYNLVINI